VRFGQTDKIRSGAQSVSPSHLPDQGGLQQPGFPVAPGHEVVDLERNADAEWLRQRDNVRKVNRSTGQRADLECDNTGRAATVSASTAHR
jgi:hypothetical protein